MKSLLGSILRIVNEFGKLSGGRRGCAAFVLYATAAVVMSGQTFTTLYTFATGEQPAGLVQSTNGHFYGTTSSGRFYRMAPGGKFTTLCTDCPTAAGTLVLGTDGNFYGYAQNTAFKITPTGEVTTIYTFCSQSQQWEPCSDGTGPSGSLAAPGWGLFGTAQNGGPNEGGTIFLMDGVGGLQTLYSFCPEGSYCSDGYNPLSGLVVGADGYLYGTTHFGGNGFGCESNCGTLFKFDSQHVLTTLHSFCETFVHGKCVDGFYPESPLIQAGDGNFFGTTSNGGHNWGGTIFKFTPSGTLTTIYSFCSGSGCTEGVIPSAALVQATDHHLYGTTQSTIFRITQGGDLTTLYTFCSVPDCDDGNPTGILLQATDGNFYGTTTGTNGKGGTVFSLSAGLAPFVKTQPTSGAVGQPVTILGTNLTGATSVRFHGTPAVFAVVSKSQITVRVPPGATSGEVKVVTPSGTLSSNLPFEVLP